MDFMEDIYDLPKTPWQGEANEIAIKTSAIAIPRRCPERVAVIHRFGPAGQYQGFSVGLANPPIERSKAMEVIDFQIDMSLPNNYLFDWVLPGAISRCLKKELGSKGSQ